MEVTPGFQGVAIVGLPLLLTFNMSLNVFTKLSKKQHPFALSILLPNLYIKPFSSITIHWATFKSTTLSNLRALPY